LLQPMIVPDCFRELIDLLVHRSQAPALIAPSA
jgi:hypothetical protein